MSDMQAYLTAQYEQDERWQEDKNLEKRFWLEVLKVCDENNISTRHGDLIVTHAFGFNYAEHDGTYQEAVKMLWDAKAGYERKGADSC